jgi:hypothetical protein
VPGKPGPRQYDVASNGTIGGGQGGNTFLGQRGNVNVDNGGTAYRVLLRPEQVDAVCAQFAVHSISRGQTAYVIADDAVARGKDARSDSQVNSQVNGLTPPAGRPSITLAPATPITPSVPTRAAGNMAVGEKMKTGTDEAGPTAAPTAASATTAPATAPALAQQATSPSERSTDDVELSKRETLEEKKTGDAPAKLEVAAATSKKGVFAGETGGEYNDNNRAGRGRRDPAPPAAVTKGQLNKHMMERRTGESQWVEVVITMLPTDAAGKTQAVESAPAGAAPVQPYTK